MYKTLLYINILGLAPLLNHSNGFAPWCFQARGCLLALIPHCSPLHSTLCFSPQPYPIPTRVPIYNPQYCRIGHSSSNNSMWLVGQGSAKPQEECCTPAWTPAGSALFCSVRKQPELDWKTIKQTDSFVFLWTCGEPCGLDVEHHWSGSLPRKLVLRGLKNLEELPKNDFLSAILAINSVTENKPFCVSGLLGTLCAINHRWTSTFYYNQNKGWWDIFTAAS